jgi:exosortase family protein XrtM
VALLAIFAGLQLGWQALANSPIQRFVIHDATVRPAVAVANWLTPSVHATPMGSTIQAAGGSLNILNGCEGMEALFLLFAAFIVAPLTWRSRLLGFLIGAVVVFGINQIRILTLFYAFRADPALFDPLHSTITPIVVVLVVCLYFYTWLGYSTRFPTVE